MPSMKSLISKIKNDFPEFTLKVSSGFRWSPDSQTVFIDPEAEQGSIFILHELSHAILGHEDYDRDINLIKLERDAWEYAQNTLASRYDIKIDSSTIQDNLDTYRDWLHARSTCPDCQATGLQVQTRQYTCLACGHSWNVNEARICALRRYRNQKHTPKGVLL